MMFVANGFEVVDIGENISPQGFIEAIKEHKPDVVGLCALLTTTMPAMAMTVEAISAAGLRDDGQLKIIVGGAPVTEEFAREINADFYGENAGKPKTKYTRSLYDADYTTNLEVLESGLRAHGPGALVNSVSAEKGNIHPFLRWR